MKGLSTPGLSRKQCSHGGEGGRLCLCWAPHSDLISKRKADTVQLHLLTPVIWHILGAHLEMHILIRLSLWPKIVMSTLQLFTNDNSLESWISGGIANLLPDMIHGYYRGERRFSLECNTCHNVWLFSYHKCLLLNYFDTKAAVVVARSRYKSTCIAIFYGLKLWRQQAKMLYLFGFVCSRFQTALRLNILIVTQGNIILLPGCDITQRGSSILI